jgi:hypothetical protein
MKPISSNSRDLILRRPAKRSEAVRLEGWPQRMDSWPSFETREERAPQDEVREHADLIQTSETQHQARELDPRRRKWNTSYKFYL